MRTGGKNRGGETEVPARTLHECEQRLKSLLALSVDWYWEQDEEHRFVLITGEGPELLGMDPQVFVGRALWDHGAVPDGDGGSWDGHWATLHARQPFADLIVKRTGESGALRYASASGQPRFDAAGRFKGYCGVARDVTASRRAEQLLRLEHAVTLCLADADSVKMALQAAIQAICETESWEYGQYWRVDEDADVLRPDAFWVAPGAETVTARFIEESRGVVFRRGVGLIGTVWQTGQPLWVADVTQDPRVLRKELAQETGLRGAFRFAAASGGKVLGVFDFATRQLRDPDARLLQAVCIIGSQIGQFLRRKQTDERICYQATHDALTALPNRAMFSELMNFAIHTARRYGHAFAVLFIDLDRFKIVNDTLGHEAGDTLLKEIGVRLAGCLRASDVVARLGGDEFVLLTAEVGDADQVSAVARKVLAAILRPIRIHGRDCRVTASIGISMFPADAQDEPSLMKHADIAMYLAKDKGKNNFQFYSVDTPVPSLERLALETGLRGALEQHELSLRYLARLDLRTGQVTGVEALLRWQHPDLGIVAPARFIPIAEETDLMVPIGRWVLRTACAQNVAWQRAGLAHLCMAVKLSARQFNDDSLIEHISGALEQSGMPADLLELEVAESVVMRDSERAIEVLGAIKRLGVRLALDDFGMGYAQIERYPVDTLKVDRSLIHDVIGNPEDKAVTEAIIAMGKSLSLTVVAEGVETQEQADFLREHACDAVQGYYFNKPMSAEMFATLLQQHASSMPQIRAP